MATTKWNFSKHAIEIRRFLNKVYPDKSIGREGPVTWSPRSPDLTNCDFFCGDLLIIIIIFETAVTVHNSRHLITSTFMGDVICFCFEVILIFVIKKVNNDA